MLIRLAPATAALLFTLTLQLDAQIDRITGKNFATRSEVLARHGMVCTSVPLATQVGLDILKRGGSAVDAAIAANATLGLMEPVSNGVGGDLFAIVYSAKENKLYGINGSGRSPLGLSYEQMKAELAKLKRETIPPTGMLPISVPGCVDAWAELHKKFGKLKLGDDLAPAIHYAEEGFPVTELIAYYWAFRSAALQRIARRFSRNLHARWQRPHAGQRRHLQESGAGEHAAPDRRERAATLFTKARSRTRSTPSCRRTADICAKPISKNIPAPGSIRSRRIIAATMFLNCRRTARASPRCKS